MTLQSSPMYQVYQKCACWMESGLLEWRFSLLPQNHCRVLITETIHNAN